MYFLLLKQADTFLPELKPDGQSDLSCQGEFVYDQLIKNLVEVHQDLIVNQGMNIFTICLQIRNQRTFLPKIQYKKQFPLSIKHVIFLSSFRFSVQYLNLWIDASLSETIKDFQNLTSESDSASLKYIIFIYHTSLSVRYSP